MRENDIRTRHKHRSNESSKGAPKAEALRRSMLALMASTGKPCFAHPALWAPFVVVGEGNAAWAVGR